MPSSCPKCGKPLEVYLLKGIKYLDCSGYPECKYRVEIGKLNQSFPIVEQNGKMTYPKVCPNCNKRIAIYIGKNGAFFGCNGYPHCRFSLSIESTKNILCPDCRSLMYERPGRRGIFLGCGGYPDCKFTYDIRISKNVESTIAPVKSQRKKLVFDHLETPFTKDKILKILSKDWHAVNQIAPKLGVKEVNDVKFLILKLKQLERKNLLISKNFNTVNYWKTSEKGTLKR